MDANDDSAIAAMAGEVRKTSCTELMKALNGRKGDLDAYLEVNNEDEIRAAILGLIENVAKTKRDEFAGQALAGVVLDGLGQPMFGDDDTAEKAAMRYARTAYKIADAMLKARKS